MRIFSRVWRFLSRASCLVGWPRRGLDAGIVLAGTPLAGTPLAGSPPAPAEGQRALDMLLADGAAAPFQALAARGIQVTARIDRPLEGGLAFCAVVRVAPAPRLPEVR